MSEKQPATPEHRSNPTSDAFRDFIASGWAPRPQGLPEPVDAARHTPARRAALSASFVGDRLVIPAGGLKVRSNDCDYVFRPHTAFAHLTGLGSDREPDAVLVLEPQGEQHAATLYFRPLAPRSDPEFFADSRYGEFWVGSRPTLESMAAELGLATAHIDDLEAALRSGSAPMRIVRDADADLTSSVDRIRADRTQATAHAENDSVQAEDPAQTAREADAELARQCSTMRLVKDDWEAEQMREACAATARAFTAVVADLPEAVKRGRGERWVEGVFGLHARHHGNGVGYDSICAAGDHANTLHWIRNSGDVGENDLILIDAGVELDSLFTADVTRTLPVSGRFTDVQRRIYDAVYAAQCAGIEACRPGNTFKDVHAAAIRVIATTLFEWGLLPDGVDVEQSLAPEGQWHRRWMVHGTSHHLGMDVHDCQQALRQDYLDATLEPGMVLTVEPGLYFKADDELVPPQMRGIGVRIEDDILITEQGHENLSAGLPRASADVERWMADIWAG